MNRARASEITYLLLRIVAGFLFIQSGALILFGWYGGMPGMPSPPPFLSQMWFGGILEFFGGILILLGLFTRPVAFLLSGMMAVAYWQFHYATQGGWPLQNNGVAAVLFCFVFLYMAAQGGGEYSLDAVMGRRRANR